MSLTNSSQLLRDNSNQLFLCLLVFLSLLFITRWAPFSLLYFETFIEKDFKQTVSMHTKTEVFMHLNGFYICVLELNNPNKQKGPRKS